MVSRRRFVDAEKVSSGWGIMRQMAIWCSLLHRLRKCSAANLLTASKLNWVAEHFFSSVITPIVWNNLHGTRNTPHLYDNEVENNVMLKISPIGDFNAK